ncbi:MAG: family 43 glycosylhydrolase [Paludibacter sp.]|jgi:beta-xylosidase|nr:family 43 glycosylhydrolase [Paludibacter sp.]
MKTKLLFIAIISVLFFTNCKTANTYENPILGGDYPDPTILRDGDDFYLTHSSFDYYPGLLVWHSTDLVHWTRISHALNRYVGSVWAPDLVKYGDKYYIYFPAGGTNWVVWADSPYGEWSEPIDLQLRGFIDPGHVVDAEGNRYLYLSRGATVPLTADGLAVAGEANYNYEGWQFPVEWSTECFCLESPKSTVKDRYFYLTVAEGGTAGPATSHMVVSARAKSPYGPWENSPYNPIVHTESRAERWWSQGHGSLVDDAKGDWWILYHAYEKDFHTLGRQMLMLPVEWTADGWFRVPAGAKSFNPNTVPAGKKSDDNKTLSDNFDSNTLGLQWQFFKFFAPERVNVRDGKLHLQAAGRNFTESSPLLVNAANRKYEVTVEYTLEGNVQAGLTLFYNERAQARVSVDSARFSVLVQERRKFSEKNTLGNHGFLRILNDENEVSFYYSDDCKNWKRLERSIDMQGYNHNVFGEFLSLRAGVYAFGEGSVAFDNFVYREF